MTTLHQVTFLLAVFGLSAWSAADASDAQAMLKERMSDPNGMFRKGTGTMTGEGVCWHTAYAMDHFLDKYRATEDRSYLDAGVKYFDACIAKMHKSPDGYLGWVGPYMFDQVTYICDVHIGDSIMINPMLNFAEFILKGKDESLRAQYGSKAEEYVKLAQKHLVEKWDKRGTWHEAGPVGAYVSWEFYMTPDNLKEWRKLPGPESDSGITLPFNKNEDFAIACLRLYRITGEDFYREKALKIFNFSKSRICLFEDHYVWSYWEPFGPWDVTEHTETPGKLGLKHWVNVHPVRNYQAGEVEFIAEAYHCGLTFTQEDLQRMINTNLKVMWNGDKAAPKFVNSYAAVRKAALGEVQEVPIAAGYSKHAGCLWDGLVDFDPTIREMAKYSDSRPVGFERRYPELPVSEFEVPFQSNRYFTMACVLPRVARKGESTYLASKCLVTDAVEISLRSADGSKQIAEIYKGTQEGGIDGHAGLLIYKWDPKDIPNGEYRVRWTLKGEYREHPVIVE